MPKRQAHHRKGKLIQKNLININDVRQRNAEQGKFRVIAVENSKNAWIIGDYVTYREAKEKVDIMPVSDIDYYVHSDSSRILYHKNRRQS